MSIGKKEKPNETDITYKTSFDYKMINTQLKYMYTCMNRMIAGFKGEIRV